MRLHTLTLTAFGPFGTTQEVDFDALSSAGLFLLHGPTGAGKTSVLDAVCYGLYGAVPGARQSPGTSLRSDHAPADLPTEVRLELTVGGRRLEVTRSPAQPRPKRRGGGFTTEKAQSLLREHDPVKGWQALSRSHQEIGEEIGRLIGMSREQFCQVVLLPQGDFARFLRADAEARGKLLGRLFDTRRFAAVEERLAELRRTAEARVRTGDEQILALAQRIAQAAGPAAGETMLPEDRPGEPGLAGGVLQWAAVARSGAHERLDIAHCALATAESRHAAARHALDAERELARLQQRYEETRRRAAGLEERRAERDRCHEQLSRARKADLVAPALELRDEAERAHRTASDARARSRAGLPGELADAGAERLAALEREIRVELGTLDAARRAEQRTLEIDAERAGLERQSRADDEMIQEAADWLAGWDTTRRDLQERIETAQEAATRAEQLAGQLAPARKRLDAAHRRDALAVQEQAAEGRLTGAREHAVAAHETWLGLRERRLRGDRRGAGRRARRRNGLRRVRVRRTPGARPRRRRPCGPGDGGSGADRTPARRTDTRGRRTRARSPPRTPGRGPRRRGRARGFWRRCARNRDRWRGLPNVLGGRARRVRRQAEPGAQGRPPAGRRDARCEGDPRRSRAGAPRTARRAAAGRAASRGPYLAAGSARP